MQLFFVIGNPVSHSRSPLLHNSAYKALQWQKVCYSRYHLNDEKVLKDTILNLGIAGANITVPFKEEAFRICDEVDMFAKQIGAVNTIVNKNGKLYGYNTDAPGFVECAKSFEYKNVLILGAGGTARALAFALKDKNPLVANRSEARLEFFKQNGFDTTTFNALDSTQHFDLIVNTTSAGLNDNFLPLDEDKLFTLLKNSNGAIDCIYGKQTPFLALAQKAGIKTQDGAQMLLEQAFLAFKNFFSNKVFDDKIVYNAMRSAFKL